MRAGRRLEYGATAQSSHGAAVRRGSLLLVALVTAVTLSGCAVRGLSFFSDDRVTILTPEDNEEVSLPFDVAWTVEDFDQRFVVFFDRTPMRPGRGLRSLVPEDDPCLRERIVTCPDENWLEARNIYVTDIPSVRVEQLPDRRDNGRGRDRHDVTIVLFGRDGKRVGESAFTREFIVERER